MGRRKKHRRGLKMPQLFWRTFYFYFYPKLMNKIFSKKKKNFIIESGMMNYIWILIFTKEF